MVELTEQDVQPGDEQDRLGADTLDQYQTLLNCRLVGLLQRQNEKHMDSISFLLDDMNSAQENGSGAQEAVIHGIINIAKTREGMMLNIRKLLDEVDAKMNGNTVGRKASVAQQMDLNVQFPDGIRLEDEALMKKLDQQLLECEALMEYADTLLMDNCTPG
ncbi:uncharacterized protein PG986_008676 [Apiospora aurea]|uniref:Uncharacterized protein n=1 Tax=Apiospora aurea TaxID=335848 RepID=A0ABR1Q5H6_9PEZI